MSGLLPTLVNGLSVGAVYALVALGIVVLYKASEVVNFAHGNFAVVGALVAADFSLLVGFWGGILAGIAATALLSLLVQRFLVAPMKNAPVVSLAIMTIGMQVILDTETTREIGPNIPQLGQPWGTSAVRIFGAVVPWNRIITIIVAVVIVGIFLAAFRFSSWGVSMRAAAEDREASELVGLKLGRIAIVSWVIAGALAAVAGIALAGAPAAGVTATISTVAMRAFPAAVIGGLDSITGALVGGLLVGVLETFFDAYQGSMTFLGLGFGDVVPYLAMFVVLLIRPQGLFGRKEVSRA